MMHRNLRTEGHVELKKANNEWTTCIANSFLPQFLKGEAVSVDEVCVEQREKMMELTEAIYGESPMPFKPISSVDQL